MTSIKDTFVQAVHLELRGRAGWEPFKSNFNRVMIEAIGAGLEAVLAPPKVETFASYVMRMADEYGDGIPEGQIAPKTATFGQFTAMPPLDGLVPRTDEPKVPYVLPKPDHLRAVAIERGRQLAKGYDAAHDDKTEYSLPYLAVDYLTIGVGSPEKIVKAIALLFAELERLERAEGK